MMLMMWELKLIFIFHVAAQVTSHEINVNCREVEHEFPVIKNNTPSFLADLNVKLVTLGEKYGLNISWAIQIDASNEYLMGTLIHISGESEYRCEYEPPLAQANRTGLQKKWFHFIVEVGYGSTTIQAVNLPLLPFGSAESTKYTSIEVPRTITVKPNVEPLDVSTSVAQMSDPDTQNGEDVPANFTSMAMALYGVLASLLILFTFFLIYKNCQTKFTKLLGFKVLPTSTVVPIPVLVVYPAENSTFQRAVVALAEFLQWHGGCSVAVDMWQQGKIAELGPMRWLAEQAKTADRVLIVCPQPSPQLSYTPSTHNLPEPSIPAAAHDLYPLILNMVASHAKSTSNLTKFWVVHLGKQQARSPSNLPLELKACKTFCLMKDLIKLCRSLHNQRQDSKVNSDRIISTGIKNNSGKLRKAVEELSRHRPSIFSEVEPLKSVVTAI